MEQNASDADIWIVSAKGSPRIRLTTNKKSDTAPRWSPDGRQLVFISAQDEKPELYLISPLWRRAGAAVGEQGRGARGGVVARRDVHRLPRRSGADGGGGEESEGQGRRDRRRHERQVHAALGARPGAAETALGVGRRGTSVPLWSPDGRTLSFGASVRTTTQLFAVPLLGGAPRALTDVHGTIGGGTLSRDGSTIACTKTCSTRPGSTSHEGVLILPAGYREGTRYPLVVAVHGGPSGAWAESFPGGWSNAGQVLAGRGSRCSTRIHAARRRMLAQTG